jgi:hypothetical protein
MAIYNNIKTTLRINQIITAIFYVTRTLQTFILKKSVKLGLVLDLVCMHPFFKKLHLL